MSRSVSSCFSPCALWKITARRPAATRARATATPRARTHTRTHTHTRTQEHNTPPHLGQLVSVKVLHQTPAERRRRRRIGADGRPRPRWHAAPHLRTMTHLTTNFFDSTPPLMSHGPCLKLSARASARARADCASAPRRRTTTAARARAQTRQTDRRRTDRQRRRHGATKSHTRRRTRVRQSRPSCTMSDQVAEVTAAGRTHTAFGSHTHAHTRTHTQTIVRFYEQADASAGAALERFRQTTEAWSIASALLDSPVAQTSTLSRRNVDSFVCVCRCRPLFFFFVCSCSRVCRVGPLALRVAVLHARARARARLVALVPRTFASAERHRESVCRVHAALKGAAALVRRVSAARRAGGEGSGAARVQTLSARFAGPSWTTTRSARRGRTSSR